AVSATIATTTSQAKEGTQTPVDRTTEQVVQGLQTPEVVPAQPVAPVQNLMWEDIERRRPVGAVPLTWHQFSTLFLEKYVPQSRRDELCRQFEWLTQGDMSVTQYEMRFSQLARHATWMILTDRERIRRFVDGLNYSLRILMTRERFAAEREREEREAKRPRGSGSFSGAPSRGQFQRGRGRSFRPPQPARPEYSRTSSDRGHQGFPQGQSLLNALPAQSSSYAPSVQGSSVPSASAGHSGVRGSLQFPSPVPGSCYECGEFGHIKRQCPRLRGGQFQQSVQPSSSAPVSSAPAQPARGGGQAARGRPRRGGRSGGGQ
uniref:Uncharacterized protein LOC104220227 n=1 Tax=Nicotiana sylvestris TaxID=4096 RepID=A0A1U7VN77_NICSY